MKHILSLGLLVILTACATQSTPPATVPATKPAVQRIATGAKITHLDAKLRFVVLDYRMRPMPTIGTKLAVYRDGQRVGAVQITDPIRTSFATADILEGELSVGDDAR